MVDKICGNAIGVNGIWRILGRVVKCDALVTLPFSQVVLPSAVPKISDGP